MKISNKRKSIYLAAKENEEMDSFGKLQNRSTLEFLSSIVTMYNKIYFMSNHHLIPLHDHKFKKINNRQYGLQILTETLITQDSQRNTLCNSRPICLKSGTHTKKCTFSHLHISIPNMSNMLPRHQDYIIALFVVATMHI